MTFNAATGATGPSGPPGAPEDIDSLPAATTPLDGTEKLQVFQAAVEKAVASADVIPGCSVDASGNLTQATDAFGQLTQVGASVFGAHSGGLFIQQSGGGCQFGFDSYSNSGFSFIYGERALGTVALPLAITTDTVILEIAGWGWGTTGFVYGSGRDNGLQIRAAGNFSDTSAPTRLSFATTAVGSADGREVASMEANGTFIATGTPTNDDAAAGKTGEYISSTLAIADGLDLVSGTAKTITSISLTAGDWDVWGVVGFTEATGTIGSQQIGAIHTTTNTLPTSPNGGAYAQRSGNTIASVGDVLPVGQKRISLASTTTVYLIASSTFTVSTNKGYGFIGARRVR